MFFPSHLRVEIKEVGKVGELGGFGSLLSIASEGIPPSGDDLVARAGGDREILSTRKN